MKMCWKCAEEIKEAAAACRFCGANQASLERTRIPQPRPHQVEPKRKGVGCGVGVAIGFLGLFVRCSQISSQVDQERAAKHAEVPVNDPAACEKIIDLATKLKLVRERPKLDRVNVDEIRWAILPASEKDALLMALSCAAHGGRSLEQLESLDGAVVYGFRSGKRLALIGSFGRKFE